MFKTSPTRIISYAVRPLVIAKYLGQISLLLGLFGLAPLLFAMADGEWLPAGGYGLIMCLLLGCGVLLARLPAPKEIQHNEALVIVALAFVLAALVFSAPFMLAGIGYIDALFTAVSGITTTGLTTLATLADKPHSFLFTMAWLQWLGGLGIIVLSFALLFRQGIAAKRLTGVLGERSGLVGGTRAYARTMLRIYLSLTLFGMATLWLAGADAFAALTLPLTAVSTGGYAPYDASLGDLNRLLQTLVILLCIAGAGLLPLYQELSQGNWRRIGYDPELRTLMLLGILSGSLLALNQTATAGWSSVDAYLLAFSAQTTAGFTTADPDQLTPFSKLLLIGAMAIGGGVGSTAGGIKLLRLLILLRLFQLMILRTRLPAHAMSVLELEDHRWSDAELVRLLTFVLLFVAAVLLSWLPFVWAGYDALDALFEVVSALGTVGLSSGITRPELEPFLKLILCLDMLLGRLEILALLVLLAPGTWLGQRNE